MSMQVSVSIDLNYDSAVHTARDLAAEVWKILSEQSLEQLARYADGSASPYVIWLHDPRGHRVGTSKVIFRDLV
jgi:hypothetical protein